LPFFSVLVPFWLLVAFCGWRGMRTVWPAAMVTGVAFAVPQFLVSNFIGPELVDVIAAVCSLGCLTLFLRWWQPADHWTPQGHRVAGDDTDARAADRVAGAGLASGTAPLSRSEVVRAWAPWGILTVFVFCWGLPITKTWLNGWFAPKFALPGLHELVVRMPPVVPQATPEAAMFNLNLLSASGTGILLAALVGGRVLGFTWGGLVSAYGATLWRVRLPLLTIALMLALGTLTRYSGLDTTLGLAFAHTGLFYPFFGTLLGWLGVALTGSDTSSNVLFGGLQKVAAGQLGLSPTLMGAANSAGGVMGKMIDAQSIVVAASATGYHGKEGEVLRYVFFHSIALASLVGLLVTLQAYVPPFTKMVVP
jgi:lactate permease